MGEKGARMRCGSALRLLAVVSAVLAVGAVACGDDGAMPSPTPSWPGVAIEPPAYSEPSSVTTGEYKPVRSGKSAREVLEPFGFEPVSGDEINGIRLFDYYTEYFHYKDLCGSSDFKEFRDYQGMVFEYLPPGTNVVGPQAAAVCPDESIASFGQEFMTCCSVFQVWYSAGNRALLHQGAGGGKFSGDVNGSPAVVVAETQEGWAHSQVAIATPNGVIVLETRDMPLEDTMRIADGIRCDEC